MTMHRRSLIAAAFALGAAAFSPVSAQERWPFEMKSFQQAQAQGKPILIEVFAPWCPTCKAQAPILSELAKQPRFKNLVVFNVDFDSQKDALRGFKAQQQSTLIVFKGGAEMGRSVGDTNKASIEALLARAI
jgi:thiol-disulfide isomerase/thioredoxin